MSNITDNSKEVEAPEEISHPESLSVWGLAWPSILNNLLFASVGLVAIKAVGALGACEHRGAGRVEHLPVRVLRPERHLCDREPELRRDAEVVVDRGVLGERVLRRLSEHGRAVAVGQGDGDVKAIRDSAIVELEIPVVGVRARRGAALAVVGGRLGALARQVPRPIAAAGE